MWTNDAGHSHCLSDPGSEPVAVSNGCTNPHANACANPHAIRRAVNDSDDAHLEFQLLRHTNASAKLCNDCTVC